MVMALTDKQIVIRLLLAFIFSALLGVERQMHRRSAGLRTHILVSIGSCLIMLTSIYVSDIYRDIVNVDPGRIAAGVITGIGFLGAGTIIREREGVKGLTTAASLWVAAGIGLATGCGFINAALYTTIIAVVVLFFLRRMESKLFSNEKSND